jgi:S1-C subfamily serine protease
MIRTILLITAFTFIIALLAGCITSAQSPASVYHAHYKKVYTVKKKDRVVATAFAVIAPNEKVSLITAGHVCIGENPVDLLFVGFDESTIVSSDIKISKTSDLCSISHDFPKNTPAFKIAKYYNFVQDVHHFGHPAGRDLSLTSGMVVGFDEAVLPYDLAPSDCHGGNVIMTPFGCFIKFAALDTTVPGAPGSSGGPLFTRGGDVIGVISYLHRATPGFLSTTTTEDLIKFLNEIHK